MYVYKLTESSDVHNLWTVGYYEPSGHWVPESDHAEEKFAAERAAFLNGGNGKVKLSNAFCNSPADVFDAISIDRREEIIERASTFSTKIDIAKDGFGTMFKGFDKGLVTPEEKAFGFFSLGVSYCRVLTMGEEMQEELLQKAIQELGDVKVKA